MWHFEKESSEKLQRTKPTGPNNAPLQKLVSGYQIKLQCETLEGS